MRKRLPGYSISLDRKKQYSQSRLQIAPVGLASRWNAGGASGTVGIGDWVEPSVAHRSRRGDRGPPTREGPLGAGPLGEPGAADLATCW